MDGRTDGSIKTKKCEKRETDGHRDKEREISFMEDNTKFKKKSGGGRS
jgi:hypothetical protein